MNRNATFLAALLPLAACATVPAGDPAAACPRTGNWQVWIEPGPDDRLQLAVDGEVDVPRGMVALVRPGPLDRSMSPGQRFVLELHRGEGPAGPQRVRGAVSPALPRYREVIIGCGGATIARLDGAAIETAD